jgi:hypothetical protein
VTALSIPLFAFFTVITVLILSVACRPGPQLPGRPLAGAASVAAMLGGAGVDFRPPGS